ncbi:phosphodiester glycosidase family protein [Chitinophaga barathri]|nr:phosphodiester glycosidase family protein [Chitinophaga barathri]
MKRVLILLAMLPAAAQAQLSWQRSAAHSEGLPAGMQVFETKDSLDGKPFRAFYLEFDPADPQIETVVRSGNGKRLTPAQYDSLEGPSVLAVINTTFFSFQTNRSLNVVVQNGKVIDVNPKSIPNPHRTIYTTRGAFGLSRRNRPDVAWVYNVGEKNTPYAYDVPVTPEINGTDTVYRQPGKKYPRGAHRWKMKEAVGGGPVLVQDGRAHVTMSEERMGGVKDFHPRSAVGYRADGKVILLVVEGRNKGVAEGATLQQLADIFTSLQCVEALNLDGGGSSALYVNHLNTIKPSDAAGQRPVPAVLVIRRKG